MSMFPIASTTLVSNAASISFTSILQTFTHLQVRVYGRTDRGTYNVGTMNVTFNNDNGANYSQHFTRVAPDNTTAIQAYGFASQNSIQVGQCAGSQAASGVFGAMIFDILDYTNTSKTKVVRGFGGVDTNGFVAGIKGFTQYSSGGWFNTNAITTLTLLPGDGASNFITGTRADLYGISTSFLTGV